MSAAVDTGSHSAGIAEHISVLPVEPVVGAAAVQLVVVPVVVALVE